MRAVRAAALALPEVVEAPHHELSSFRVRGRIFATVPDDAHVRIMLDEPDVLAAIAEAPASCERLWWGSRLAGVVMTIRTARIEVVRGLLAVAWLRRAPAALAASVERSASPPRS